MARRRNIAGRHWEDLVDTVKVARQLDIIADLLAVDGASLLLSHSYRRVAARVRESLPAEMESKAFDDSIRKIPGVSRQIAARVRMIARDKHPNLLDILTRIFPPSLSSLLLLPDLGPRRVNLIYNELGISSIDELEVAAFAGKLRPLPGFGPVLEQRLLATIRQRKAHSHNYHRSSH